MHIWPTFKSHHQAQCFNCGRELHDKPTPTLFAKGAWWQRCGECDLATYYDIEPKENER